MKPNTKPTRSAIKKMIKEAFGVFGRMPLYDIPPSKTIRKQINVSQVEDLQQLDDLIRKMFFNIQTVIYNEVEGETIVKRETPAILSSFNTSISYKYPYLNYSVGITEPPKNGN